MNAVTLSWDMICRKKADIVSRSIADEHFLIPVRGNLADMKQIYILSPVAEFIWHLLDGEKSLGEIVTNIESAFSVARADAERDLLEFVSELLQCGLAEIPD